MAEQLLSVGIDIGTSTTQLVLSRLTLENRANAFSVPRVDIAEREVLYRSGIHFTPLKSETEIDEVGVRAIVEEEYRNSGFEKQQVETGAVIITGETARKENARAVLSALAEFAGDFVVTTAGPDLESILAARGAGADRYSKEQHTEVLHFDIGGGTSNLALYSHGVLKAVGCFDVGGRLIKLDRTGSITYVSPVVQRLAAQGRIPVFRPGQRGEPGALTPLLTGLTKALEQAAGLCPGREWMDALQTDGTRWDPPSLPVTCSFSGGVADCIYGTADWLAYGDIGPLLGQSIRKSGFQTVPWYRGTETIRATVVGAGSHATELSGSTIFYREIRFPLKNLPLIKLTPEEERGTPSELATAIREKVRWFNPDGEPAVLGLRGERSPSYTRIQELACGLVEGLAPLREAGHPLVVAVEADFAKVLGQAMALQVSGPLLCLDSIHVDSGDYLDIGAPAAGGRVLPVIVKTLVFGGDSAGERI